MRPQQEDAAQHELADGRRVCLRIRERERAAPRAAEHEPARDSRDAGAALHVRDEMPGRVGFERRVRPAPARAALIEHDDAVAGGIEEAPSVDVAAAAGAAVHEQRGLARRVSGLLVVDLVARVDLHEARLERLDRRVQLAFPIFAHLRSLAPASATALILTQRRMPRARNLRMKTVSSPSAQPLPLCSVRRRPRAPGPGNPVRGVLSRQRPARHRARGPQGADRRRQRLVPRRLEEREARQDRLRAPVRAPDVQRQRELQRRLLQAVRGGRRDEHERHDQRRPHELLPERADVRARPRAVARVRPHGPPARRRSTRRGSTSSAASCRTRSARARTQPYGKVFERDRRRTCSRRAIRTRGT